MFERIKTENLNDYFLTLTQRKRKGVLFYRLNGYNNNIENFLQDYYEAARKNGVIIEGNLKNPDEKNLSYYSEIMGMDFKLNMNFIISSLKKWLPRMNDNQRYSVAGSIYDTLYDLYRSGKNENILKNAYIKFMCWLYYRFERIVNHLGEDKIPKILYEGSIKNYELLMMNILSLAGCDILLLQYLGDTPYLKVDPVSKFSFPFEGNGLGAFPNDFSLKTIRQLIEKKYNLKKISGGESKYSRRTNTWIDGNITDDIKKSSVERGTEPDVFYNCFCRINGVEDKLTYANDMYTFYQELKKAGRHVAIAEKEIPLPSVDEIAEIHRRNNQKADLIIMDLASNIEYPSNNELKMIMKKAFVEIVTEFSQSSNVNNNKLMNTAVYLLCWLRRYQKQLFNSWKIGDIGCFIYLGGCKNLNEVLFLKILSRLPVDVLILVPDLNCRCCLEDNILYEVNNTESMTIDKYPCDFSDIKMETAAFQAERELDTILYNDSGMFRSQQFIKANAISLRTMYEEIRILWNQELKYRPNFSTVGDIVNMPVIFSKISGVKNGDLNAYWRSIAELITDDTILINRVPYITSVSPNPIKAHAVGFIKNGRLQREKIKSHQCYKYGFLRQPIQEYMLDKIQLLIDSKKIRGTFQNGTEYTIISVALNLNRELLRMIQSFDFTKKNPKLIFVSVGEAMFSIEDSILISYLNLLGFDIIIYVPTGYRSVEAYINDNSIEEHQIGEYMYDLNIPDLNKISINHNHSLYDKIFRRGV